MVMPTNKGIQNLAAANKRIRQDILKRLYGGNPPRQKAGQPIQQNDPVVAGLQMGSRFLGSFQRFVGNQPTYTNRGAGRAGGVSHPDKQRIEAAFAQVLGRAPGQGAESFMATLKEAFPFDATTKQINLLPSRGAVSLQITNLGDNASMVNSLLGQLSAQQATLYRQASVVAADALRVLAGLRTFIPDADYERVENLRSAVQIGITQLVEEYGRLDTPRTDRVEVLKYQLQIHLANFGKVAYLDDPNRVAVVDDEQQTTGFKLLQGYIEILVDIWERYSNPAQLASFSLSERIATANILLPILAQANYDFMDALDSVGFTESERRSEAANFIKLSNYLSNMTVNDLTDWLERFSNLEGPSILTNSGLYGLDYVSNQADRLFRVVGEVVLYLRTNEDANFNRIMLAQILSNERIGWALDGLIAQLNELADLIPYQPAA